ncbi:MAG: glycosyltransferase family 4 protein [Bacteroides sp.]
MGFSKFALAAAERFRPVLLKIVPQSMLSSIKENLVRRNTNKLKNAKIVPYDRTYPEGINLIGNIRAETGLGQSTRLVSDILEASGEAYVIHDFFVPPGPSMNDHTHDDKISEELPYDINIFHVNASEFTVAFINMGKQVWDHRYNIAYWLWELEEFPDEWLGCIDLVDEIWTPADFITNTLKKYTDKPVMTLPYCVEAPTDEKFDREFFGLPDDVFLFLMMFDSGSIMERKNPDSVFAAYKEAFGTDNDKVGIVVKINEYSKEDIDYIHEALKGYTNVYILSETLTKVQVNSLIKAVDVFVSLHRAEGFGLVLAEAMIAGTPTIATNWSANTEFACPEAACMVDYKMIEIEKDIPPYKKGYHWADADVTQAAGFMKRLYEDREFYESIAKNAKRYVAEKLNMERSTRIVKERVEDIRKKL